jgi:hypothetical protein
MKSVFLGIAAAVFVFVGYVTLDKFNVINCPHTGEVWRWSTKTNVGNPFRETRLKPYYDYEVLDVQNGYVKYMDLRDSSIESCSINWFKISSKKIK